jgi:anti-anti-sigma regulatory factor
MTAVVITLPARVDVTAAVALRADVLAAGTDLVIHAGAVAMIGTAGVQVLLAARSHQRERGLRLVMSQPSHALLGSLSHLGLSLDAVHTTGAGA